MNKFFNNISYKNKVICFSGLLLTTSIVSPLTSCGSDGTSNDIGGFDKEFGFDAQTYNNLERQFASKYSASLKEKDIYKDVYINKFNNFLQNDLVILRNKLFDPAQNYSFTVRTNTLMDYASKNYNIQLNRNTNISQIDFDNLKQLSLENFIIYMENAGFTKAGIDERKAEFNKKFDEILKDCKSKIDDNAQILMQLRTNVIDCWQNLNDDIACLSAYNHLKKFFDEYEFTVNAQKSDNDPWWDELLNDFTFMGSKENCGKIDQDINHPIGDDWIKKLFTISSKKTKKSEKKGDKDTPTTDISSDKTIVTYKNDMMIPGFILTPVLKTMSQNIYSNEYYMNIDWQLIHAKYQDKDQETKNKVTAHLATAKDKKAIDYTDFKDGQLSSDNYQFTRYNLLATSWYQREKLSEAYFDQSKEPDQKITFSWDKDAIGIEYFLPSDAKNVGFDVPTKPYKVPMTRDNLSSIGLQLNGTNLSDLLDKKTNLQDNQSTNIDDNLRIEEKFVKYCNINSNSIVSFSDNEISNNTIQNSFTVAFTNSNNIEYKVETKSNMNNIGPSKNFSNNAINFYKQVANYVDSKKILDDTESLHFFTNLINIQFYILFGIILLLLICIIVRYESYFYKGWAVDQQLIDQNVHKDDRRINLIWWSVLTIATSFLFLLWILTVSIPISNEVDEVKKWNDKINGSKSGDSKKINVIEKVNGDDKNNFKSVDNFMKYYEEKSNSAFKSYFYYFHFVELSQKQTNKVDDEQKQTNNELSTTLVEEVKKDYDDFNKTKNGLNIGNRNFGRIIIQIILIFVILLAAFLVYANSILTFDNFKKWIQYVKEFENDQEINRTMSELQHFIII